MSHSGESDSDRSSSVSHSPDEHKWLDDELKAWKQFGPYNFDTLCGILKECAKVRWTIEDDLDDVVHLFPAAEFAKLISPRAKLNAHDYGLWLKAAGNWKYKGQYFELLNAEQRLELSHHIEAKPDSIRFLAGKLDQPSILEVLNLASVRSNERIARRTQEIKELKAKKKRDKSPNRAPSL